MFKLNFAKPISRGLIFLLLLVPGIALSQNTISGKVVSLSGKSAIVGASVFLNNASAGCITNNDGSFTMGNVKDGQYDLVISCIGYEAWQQKISVYNTRIVVPTIKLVPKINVLKEVKILSDKARNRYLNIFLAEFFGLTDYARDCKLLNPEILDFKYDKETTMLTASADDFLLIENAALGYKIKYLLQSFMFESRIQRVSFAGYSVFEPMKGSHSRENRWQKRRVEAYSGSLMHFLRSCRRNLVHEEGFKVQKVTRILMRPPDSVIFAKLKFYNDQPPEAKGHFDSLQHWQEILQKPKYGQAIQPDLLKSTDYLKVTNKKGVYALSYPGVLSVKYKKGIKNSIATFQRPFALFDDNGILADSESSKMEGYWGAQRVADMLPVDYEIPNLFQVQTAE
jgi:hypothetical protein